MGLILKNLVREEAGFYRRYIMDKKTLIIVESPAKSNTISKYLGKDYTIGSSMGHVRDLPPAVLGIDLKNRYKPSYVDLAGKKQVIRELKKLAQKAKRILLASDPDREGEAIAFHLQEILQSENSEIFRVLFHEITPAAVLEAVKNPMAIDINKVNSQQMRRLLDRLAGYKISPVLQPEDRRPAVGRTRAVHRPETDRGEGKGDPRLPARGVLDRRNGCWRLAPPPFRSKLEKYNGKTLKIKNKEQCDEVLGRADRRRVRPGPDQEKSKETQGASAADHLDPAAGSVPPLQVPGQKNHAEWPSSCTKGSTSTAARPPA